MKWVARMTIQAAMLTGLAVSGCAAPAKVITGITSNNDQIKFLYVQGSSQGIIKCAVGPAGALSKCREMTLTLEE
jgi:hypothetical protein